MASIFNTFGQDDELSPYPYPSNRQDKLSSDAKIINTKNSIDLLINTLPL